MIETLGEAFAPAYRPPGFKARLGFKGNHLALGAAEALQVPMPVASLLHDRFLALLATGAGDLDWSALAALASRDAGDVSALSTADREGSGEAVVALVRYFA